MKRSRTSIDLAIVIPTLNEEQGIATTIEGIRMSLGSKLAYKVIVVDGMSIDKTVEMAMLLRAEVIKQLGRGYGDALQVGFLYVSKSVKSEFILMMDADGTYEPNDIVRMINYLKNREADVVIGNRFANMDEGAMTIYNKIGNKIISTLFRMLFRVCIKDTVRHSRFQV
jgi:dolichol-phosphate mannosyltransferase